MLNTTAPEHKAVKGKLNPRIKLNNNIKHAPASLRSSQFFSHSFNGAVFKETAVFVLAQVNNARILVLTDQRLCAAALQLTF